MTACPAAAVAETGPTPDGHAVATGGLALLLAAGLLAAPPAKAGTVELVAGPPLDFGAMVVLGKGTKQITPDGLVSASGLATVGQQREGPAAFTLRYRPDSRARSALVLVSMATPGAVSAGATTGAITALSTDLPGLGALSLGDLRTVRLPPCAAAVCDTTFRIGGTLTLSGGTAPAAFSFPLQVTVRLLAEL